MKNLLKVLTSRIMAAEDKISEMEDELTNTCIQLKKLKIVKINEQKMEIFLKESKINLWDKLNGNNKSIIGV